MRGSKNVMASADVYLAICEREASGVGEGLQLAECEG